MNFAQDSNLWLVIWALGLGTFGLRFLFLGVVGDRKMGSILNSVYEV